MRNSSLVFIVFVLAFAACKYGGGKRVNGNRNVTTQQRNITDFSAIEVKGSFDVYVSQGDAYAVRVEAEENLMDYIVTEKDGDELEVHFKRNYNIRSHHPVKIYVTAPSYAALSTTGSGDIISQTKISNASRLDIDISGSGDVNLELDAPTINTEIGGSGSALLKGSTRTLNAEIAGSGTLKAYDLLTEVTDIDVAGSGDAQVFASKQLDVKVAGSGSIQYKGNPTINQRISGSGSVRKGG